MTAPVLLLGFCAVLSVAAVGMSLFAVWRAQTLLALADRRAGARIEELQATTAALQKTVEGQAAQLEDVRQQQSPPEAVPAVPRAGLNLGKRSQVLRMHRNGDAPERIAAALDVPRQEIELLIKVHRLVVGKL
jgi:hypothetical protein